MTTCHGRRAQHGPEPPPESTAKVGDDSEHAAMCIGGCVETKFGEDVCDVGLTLAAGDDSIVPALGAELLAEPDGPFDRSAFGLFEVVMCADDAASFDDRDTAAVKSPGVWEDLLLGWHLVCDVWDVEPIEGGRLVDPSGDVPVLVTSGGLDPITPPVFADEVRRQFPNTAVALLPSGGHGVAFADDCLTSMTLAFIAEPGHPIDTSCTDSLSPPFSSP